MKATVPCPFCATLNRVELDRLAAGPKCGSCKRPLHFDRPIAVGDDSFDAVLRGTEVPVLVDFYADWCGPCKIIAPLVDQMANERAGSALFLKLDTDRHPAVSMRYGVRGIPTLIAFKGGKESGRKVGVAQRPELEALLRQ